MTIAAGTKLGRYEIRAPLGAGGMGEVYLAEDTQLDRNVALKILPADLVANQERIRRFTQEAKAASSLNHPNIITIHEIGEIESNYFIATEFIDGETLRQYAKRRRMKIGEVLTIAIQVADALAAAHDVGIVHRDIKPENVMVRRRDGYIKVLDFGLAKLTESQTTSLDTEAPTKALIATEPGVVMGTVEYMSPEQARGQPVDARTDIFSLGAVLYEMVTRRTPFVGETPTDIVVSILEKEPPPLSGYAPNAPAELQRIVRKALAKERDERYQTARDLLIDLKNLRRELDIQSEIERSIAPSIETPITDEAPANQRTTGASLTRTTGVADRERPASSAEYLIGEIKGHKRGALLALATLVMVLGGLSFGWYQWGRQRPSKSEVHFQEVKLNRLTTTGKTTTAAISPDGKYVAYALRDGGQQSLWLRQVAITSNVQIVSPAEVDYAGMTFSRDGNYLYYVKGEALYQMPLFGGTTRKLIANVAGPVTFSPDGQQLAFVREDPSQGETALIKANADGSGEQKLAARKQPSQINPESAAWSPKGEIIVFSVNNVDATGQYTSVVAVRVADGREATITSQRWRHIPSLAWLSDGSGLVMIARDRASAACSPYQVWYLSYPGGESRRITNDFQDYRSVSLTADSRALVAVQEDRLINLWVTRLGESDRAQQILGASQILDSASSLSWTPDSKIVYTSFASGNWDIWIAGPDGSNQKQLTFDPSSDNDPSVSPDGRYIVFSSFRTGAPKIWRMDLDGANPMRLTSGSWDQNPDCSPDDKWVVYSSNSSGKTALWKVVIEGGTPVQLTNKYSDFPAISPDGKLIACYYKNDQPDSPTTIAFIPFEGGEPIKILDIPRSPVRWTTDGRALTYIDTRKGVSNLWSQPLAGGPPKQLTNFQSETIFSFAWSRDGKQLALIRGVVNNDVVLISGFK